MFFADVPHCSSSTPQRITAVPGETLELACKVLASPHSSITYDWWTSGLTEGGKVSQTSILMAFQINDLNLAWLLVIRGSDNDDIFIKLGFRIF